MEGVGIRTYHTSTLSYMNAIYVGHLGECRHFYVEDGVVMHETINVLCCNHAEADTRICRHAKVIDDVGNAVCGIRDSEGV